MFTFRSLITRKNRPVVTKSAPHGQKARQTFRPEVEALEDRTVPSTFEVIPIGAPADGVTTFHSLFAALHKTAPFVAGDVIQIEPGSNPGTVLNADLQVPAVANITIQGDLAAAGSLANIPHFTVGDFYQGATAESGWTFKNVNIDLNTAGAALPAIELQGGGTITGSTITIGKNANIDFFVDFFAGATANAVNSFTNNTIVLGTPTTAATTNLALLEMDAGTSASQKDVITGNTFQANAAANFLIDYDGAGVVGQTEQVANNTFIGSAGSNLTALVNVGFFNALTGMTIQGNTFTDPDSTAAGVIGLNLDESGASMGSAQSAMVTGNVFNLTGAKAVDIAVIGGTAGKTTTTDTINNNVLGAPGGTGLKITAGATAGGVGTGDVVNVTAQGNNFNNDQFGVQVVTNANTSPANLVVDLGGGANGSAGGNNFRGDPTTGSAAGGSIVVSGANPAAPFVLKARNNIFGSATGTFVAAALANATIDTGGNLTGNAAFVETLYVTLLGRVGDTTNPNDAGNWVNQLNSNSMSQAAVAATIDHSTEALDRSIGQLYVVLLNRQADAGGLASFVTIVQNGGTLEQIAQIIVTSPEYAALTGNDLGFVQSLYTKILGRTGSQGEVLNWVEMLGKLGRAGVANDFLTSAEFRSDVVTTLYGPTLSNPSGPSPSLAGSGVGLLHRTAAPTASEVNSWVNSSLDILSIETMFLSSPEYFLDG